MKRKKITIYPYYQILEIIVCKNFTKNLDKNKLTYDKSLPVNSWESFVAFEYDKIWIFLRSKTDAGVIAHEAVHITNYVFKHANITLDINNDEPYAYLLGWIVEEIHKVQKK